MEQKPKISVILKVYNAARFIESSVHSILNQTFKNFELITIDDGSTDESWAILRDLANKDQRIKLHRNMKNMGLPKTGNLALKLASAEFIAIQDADDWSYPDRLDRQVRFLEKNPECVALGSQMMMVNSDGLPIRLWKVPLSHADIDFRHINGFGLQLPHPTLMTRADTMRLVEGYREEFPFSDDFDLLLRLAEVGKVENLPDVLVRHTKHGENISRLKKDMWYRYKHKATFQAWDRRGIGTPAFKTIPNPSLRFREGGSRMVGLFIYGLKNVLRKPGSPEGWLAFKGSTARLVRKRRYRKRNLLL